MLGRMYLRLRVILHLRQRLEERLSALGNCVATNDYVALLHPDLDRQTEVCSRNGAVLDHFFAEVFDHASAWLSNALQAHVL